MSGCKPDDPLAEIVDLNLSWLLLAQRLLREDRAMGMFRLGVSAQLASVLEGLTVAQTVQLARSGQLLCAFRLDDQALLAVLSGNGKPDTLRAVHTGILLAGQPAEEIR